MQGVLNYFYAYSKLFETEGTPYFPSKGFRVFNKDINYGQILGVFDYFIRQEVKLFTNPYYVGINWNIFGMRHYNTAANNSINKNIKFPYNLNTNESAETLKNNTKWLGAFQYPIEYVLYSSTGNSKNGDRKVFIIIDNLPFLYIASKLGPHYPTVIAANDIDQNPHIYGSDPNNNDGARSVYTGLSFGQFNGDPTRVKYKNNSGNIVDGPLLSTVSEYIFYATMKYFEKTTKDKETYETS